MPECIYTFIPVYFGHKGLQVDFFGVNHPRLWSRLFCLMMKLRLSSSLGIPYLCHDGDVDLHHLFSLFVLVAVLQWVDLISLIGISPS